MRASIRTIAAEAGVSRATVSNVLRGNDSRTSAETRERVLETVQRLNYVPVKPPTAQNRHVETRTVTLVPEHRDMDNFDLDLYTYHGIVIGARKYGYNILTMVQREFGKNGVREELQFLDRSSDGFIFTASMHDQWLHVLDILAEYQVPSVVCYSRNVPDGVAWVDVDNANAVQQAVAHLVERGHSQIAFLAGPPDNFNANLRRKAWIKCMEEHGLDAGEKFIVQAAGVGYQRDPKAFASVAKLGATAVVCFNDTLALELWDVLKSQGLSVPNDISLIGIDNRPEAAEQGLTSIAFSFAEVGRLAMDAWMELKDGGNAAKCCKLASVELVKRQSVLTL
jgi:DNA-binding LacI/PurR family transcriptional regulator